MASLWCVAGAPVNVEGAAATDEQRWTSDDRVTRLPTSHGRGQHRAGQETYALSLKAPASLTSSDRAAISRLHRDSSARRAAPRRTSPSHRRWTHPQPLKASRSACTR